MTPLPRASAQLRSPRDNGAAETRQPAAQRRANGRDGRRQSGKIKHLSSVRAARRVLSKNHAADVAPVAVRVARELLSRIRSGELAVGQRLPTEQLLAKQFGVSRPSLREALSALQFAGYVESRQGFGSVVVAPGHDGSRGGVVRTDALDPVDVLEARLLIEPEAARIAAADPDEASLREARSMLEGMWVAVEAEGGLGIDSDIGLHMAIARICRNPLIRQTTLNLLDVTNPPQWRTGRTRVWTDPSTVQLWAIEHEATLSAIQARQSERAARCARHHLLSTVASIAGRTGLAKEDRGRLRKLLQQHTERPREPSVAASGESPGHLGRKSTR